MANSKQDKARTRITSLDSFVPSDVDVELEFDDHVDVVPMRTLSYAEFQRLGWEVPMPTPPISGVDGSKRPVFDYNDATYQRAVQDAERRRAYKRLLAALKLDVPGDDDEAKIAYLQALDANKMRLLLNVIGQLVTEGEARIEARAAAFQRG